MRAREKGVSWQDLADAFLHEYFKDMNALHINSIKKYAKATDYIKEIIHEI
jgi:cysteinyl-tRNA synthetase